jgi:hypothetical protein
MECSRPYGFGMGEAGCSEDESPLIRIYCQKELGGTVKGEIMKAGSKKRFTCSALQ